MNKIKLAVFAVLGTAVLTMGLYSCSDEEMINSQQEESKTVMSTEEYQPNFNIGIAKWDWHRKKHDCKRGFGICNGEWFPSPDPQINPIITPTLPEPFDEHTMEPTYMALSSDNINENNELNFEIHINEEVNDPDNVMPLIIDEDIYFVDADGNEYKINAGTYEYDISIGNYGGYSIN